MAVARVEIKPLEGRDTEKVHSSLIQHVFQ